MKVVIIKQSFYRLNLLFLFFPFFFLYLYLHSWQWSYCPYCKVATSIGGIIYELTLVQEPISITRVATINIVRDTNSVIPLKVVKIKTIELFPSELQSYKNNLPSHNNMPYSSSFHITNRRIWQDTLHIPDRKSVV